MDAPAPVLQADFLAMVAKGVSVIVGSADHRLTPSLMRGVGSTVSADGRDVTVFVSRRQSHQLLQDIAASGRLAAVFSQPSTHLTVQFKTRRVRLREATEADRPALQRYLQSMEHELSVLGYPAVFARAMLVHRLDDLVAIEFQPEQAFNQTPGHQAGQPIGGTA